MSKLKTIRELQNLTQEELSEKSGVSVRTIQRIESGKDPKGFTLRALAKELNIPETKLLNKKMEANENSELSENENSPEELPINFSKLKLINLSSIPFIILPLLNFLIPAMLMYTMKQTNAITKQIISLQIIWSISAPIIFILGLFLKLGNKFTLVLLILIILSNVFLIIRNAIELDRNQKLYYKLNFSML
ncbi:protein of unknown function [Halpernia humi]|uniref:HTH cro/C1-type domain-containing protein n=1 Tax=Halpernia humi TaxID=493375 RepID=A0A1H6AJW8_9FLAO|nr:helix-turn-helix domain-containing protein [Halpernia humi]SEG48454.1 protein of unknown function [Halpernia humi]